MSDKGCVTKVRGKNRELCLLRWEVFHFPTTKNICEEISSRLSISTAIEGSLENLASEIDLCILIHQDLTMNKSAPPGLRIRESDASFPAGYYREEHIGRQAPPKQSFVTVLGRKTEDTFVSRILQDSCLNVYNENHMIGKFILELTDSLDQSSAAIVRGYAAYEQVELKWWETEPSDLVWAVAGPRHLIARYKLLKREFEAILMDCEIEASSPGREPSVSRYFQMLSSEPGTQYLVELKSWTADMRVLIDEVASREKTSADLSGLRQVHPA